MHLDMEFIRENTKKKNSIESSHFSIDQPAALSRNWGCATEHENKNEWKREEKNEENMKTNLVRVQ